MSFVKQDFFQIIKTAMKFRSDKLLKCGMSYQELLIGLDYKQNQTPEHNFSAPKNHAKTLRDFCFSSKEESIIMLTSKINRLNN